MDCLHQTGLTFLGSSYTIRFCLNTQTLNSSTLVSISNSFLLNTELYPLPQLCLPVLTQVPLISNYRTVHWIFAFHHGSQTSSELNQKFWGKYHYFSSKLWIIRNCISLRQGKKRFCGVICRILKQVIDTLFLSEKLYSTEIFTLFFHLKNCICKEYTAISHLHETAFLSLISRNIAPLVVRMSTTAFQNCTAGWALWHWVGWSLDDHWWNNHNSSTWELQICTALAGGAVKEQIRKMSHTWVSIK